MSVVRLVTAQPDPKIITMLEELVVQAKAGDIYNIAIVGETTNGCTFTECKGQYSVGLIGEMTLFTNELASIINNICRTV